MHNLQISPNFVSICRFYKKYVTNQLILSFYWSSVPPDTFLKLMHIAGVFK